MRLQVEVPHVAGLEHQPDDFDSRQLVRWNVNSELELRFGLAKVRLVVLVALVSRSTSLAASIASLGVVVASEASIVGGCLDRKLLEQIVGLWSLDNVEVVLILVDVEEHCSDGQEPVQLNVADYLRIRKYLLVEEPDYEGRAEPVLLED